MSLQVWLPLNGNLNNNGVADAVITNSGATVDTDGKIGSCYSFDGSASYIDITCSKFPDFFNSEFSICFWCYNNDNGGRSLFFGNYGLTGQFFNIEKTASNTIRFWWNSDPDITFSSCTLTSEAWTHVVITRNSNTVKCYVNGELKQTSTNVLNSAPGSTATTFRLGRDSRTGATALNGKLNDFRVYDHALSAKEVKEISKALILHIPLDNNGLGSNAEAETTVYDTSGYCNNCTLSSNKPTIVANSPRYSACMSFNGSNNFIMCGKNAKVKDAITVNLWVYVDDWSSFTGIPISCTQSGGWNFQPESNGTIGFTVGTGTSANVYKKVVSITTRSSLSGWIMLTGTYDGFNTKIYINGTLDNTTIAYDTKTPIYYYASNGIFVGAEAKKNTTGPEGSYFNGKISDVRIYATALSDEDIIELYNKPISIDNTGKVFTMEYTENSNEES